MNFAAAEPGGAGEKRRLQGAYARDFSPDHLQAESFDMLKQKIGYITAILLSLALLELGFGDVLYWYGADFPWSPPGGDGCGLEFLAILFVTYPAFCLGLLLRWKIPHRVWCLPVYADGLI